MLELRTLGALALYDDSGRSIQSVLARPKLTALLVYLIIRSERGLVRRDVLRALFWPELSEERARASLSQALHQLRRELGEDVLVGRGDEEVAVDRSRIACDATAFLADCPREDLEAALVKYQGPFLDGFHLAESVEFEEWIDETRHRIDRSASDGAERLARTARRDQQFELAIKWARLASERAPLGEAQARLLIELLAESGDRSSALTAYDDFAKRLNRQLEVPPSAELQRFISRLRESDTTRVPTREPIAIVTAGEGSLADSLNPAAAASHPFNQEPSSVTPRRHRMALVGAVTIGFLLITLFAIQTFFASSGSRGATRRQLTFSGNVDMPAVSPDGQFIAYLGSNDSGRFLLVQDVAGGQPVTVGKMEGLVTLEWSPDGTQLLIGGTSQALIVPRLGGEPRAIPAASHFPAGAFAYWLDDAHVTLYQQDVPRLLMIDLRTQDSVSIPVSAKYTWMNEGSWSPDGRLFAVATELDDPARWSILSVSRNGQTEIVFTDTLSLASVRWSADGKYLYFLRDGSSIWRVRIAPRTGKRRGDPTLVQSDLEILPGQFASLPRFSVTRDGHLVYARGAQFANLWAFESRPDSLAPRSRRLTVGTALRWSPSVSPDGRWIAYAQATREAVEIYRMPFEGGPASQITLGARVWPRSQIAWSPDGKSIAFVSVRQGRANVWIANVASGELRQLGRTRASLAPAHVAWSPGQEIAYQQYDNGGVRLVDPSTGLERVLAGPKGSIVVDTAWSGFFSPLFSPDGKRLAVWRNRQGRMGTWVFDLRDSTSLQIDKGGDWPRGWSDDGRYIYRGSPVIYRIDTRGILRPQAVLIRPQHETGCLVASHRGPTTFVCERFDRDSDIWMIENFDLARR